MNDEVAERLTRLESAIAHLERLTEQLNEVIIDQRRQLDHLKKKLDLQGQSLETIELERIRSTNPKPPHYQ
jgi:SlyX protein